MELYVKYLNNKNMYFTHGAAFVCMYGMDMNKGNSGNSFCFSFIYIDGYIVLTFTQYQKCQLAFSG